MPVFAVTENNSGPSLESSVFFAIDMSRFDYHVAEEIAKALADVKAEPSSASTWGSLGKLLQAYDLDLYAERAYERAIKLDPSDAHWHHLAGLAVRVRDPQRAIGYLHNGLALNPRSVPGMLKLASLYERTGETTKSAQLYSDVLAQDPESFHALVGSARSHMRQGRFDDARISLEYARTIVPSHGAIHTLLAQVYTRLGLTDEVELSEIHSSAYPDSIPINDEIYDSMTRLARSPTALAERGLSYAVQGDLQRAEKLFRQVLKRRSRQAQDYNNLGITLAQQRRLSEAMSVFDQALEFAPQDVELLSNRGLTLLRMGNLEGARSTLTAALTVNSAHPVALFNLASVHLQKGELAKAIPLLEKAIAIKTGLLDARENLGAAYAATGKIESAIRQWEVLAAIRPRDLDLLFRLGSAYVQMKKLDRALQVMEQGHKIAPDSVNFSRAIEELSRSATD